VRGVDKGIGSSLARRLLMLDARHMGWSEMRIVGLIKAPPSCTIWRIRWKLKISGFLNEPLQTLLKSWPQFPT
jgi:hypothetical protein